MPITILNNISNFFLRLKHLTPRTVSIPNYLRKRKRKKRKNAQIGQIGNLLSVGKASNEMLIFEPCTRTTKSV